MSRPMVVVDTETGGLHPRSHALLEVGAVFVADGTIHMDVTYNHVIKPAFGKVVTEEALAVNNLTLEDLAVASSLDVALEYWEEDYLKRVYTRVQELGFDSKDLVFGAWNSSFDAPFLLENGFWMPARGRMVCLWSYAMDRGLPLAHLHLQDVAAHYNIPVGRAHRALEDAVTAARVHLRMKGEGVLQPESV